MRQVYHQRHQHSLLWWLIIGIVLIFGSFLVLVSIGLLPAYEEVLQHSSIEFFLLTLIFTIIMSYCRAKFANGKHYVGPFLCAILFAILTQFILFLISPFFN